VLLMFAYLLRRGYGSEYPEVLVPGMLALTTVFGLEGTMTAIVADADRGITDRFRSLPMAGSAVIAGRGIADLLNAIVGLLVLMACGLAMGWSWHDGALNALAAVGLLLALRFALIWIGLYLGLVAGPAVRSVAGRAVERHELAIEGVERRRAGDRLADRRRRPLRERARERRATQLIAFDLQASRLLPAERAQMHGVPLRRGHGRVEVVRERDEVVPPAAA
jgi:hypothetical protein